MFALAVLQCRMQRLLAFERQHDGIALRLTPGHVAIGRDEDPVVQVVHLELRTHEAHVGALAMDLDPRLHGDAAAEQRHGRQGIPRAPDLHFEGLVEGDARDPYAGLGAVGGETRRPLDGHGARQRAFVEAQGPRQGLLEQETPRVAGVDAGADPAARARLRVQDLYGAGRLPGGPGQAREARGHACGGVRPGRGPDARQHALSQGGGADLRCLLQREEARRPRALALRPPPVPLGIQGRAREDDPAGHTLLRVAFATSLVAGGVVRARTVRGGAVACTFGQVRGDEDACHEHGRGEAGEHREAHGVSRPDRAPGRLPDRREHTILQKRGRREHGQLLAQAVQFGPRRRRLRTARRARGEVVAHVAAGGLARFDGGEQIAHLVAAQHRLNSFRRRARPWV
ncbi:MAG: hypothetical protein P1V36_04335 [Planctomycetota bacterium]|nr:hypothetical protein [Planctomycetota bacterium]